MAIWFPNAADIEANKVDLEKDDAIVVHRPRRGRDFQTPIGDSLDHRYAPIDHRHDDAAGEHEHEELNQIQSQLDILQSLVSGNGQKIGKLDTEVSKLKEDLKGYLPLGGGTLTGTLKGKLFKSIRDDGYAFEVKPDDVEDATTAFIRANGSASFTGSVKVDGSELAKVNHTHDDITGEIQGLQNAFDTAVLAAQEGADNLQIELQSYLKKDDANASFLKLAGGTMTGPLDLDQEDSSSVFRVKQNGQSKLKIYPNGTVETQRISFSNNHLVSKSFTDSTYASQSHKHIKGDEPLNGPARFRWKYTSTTDPADYHASVEDQYIRLSILPSEPQVNWKVCDNHGDEITIDAELAIYSYSENSNGSNHRKYRWKLAGLAHVTKAKYYVLNTGYFNRFYVRQWRKAFDRPSEEDTFLWVTISGLLS